MLIRKHIVTQHPLFHIIYYKQKRQHSSHESRGCAGFIFPIRWQNTLGLVITCQSVDSGFYQNQTKLGILVLPTIKMYTGYDYTHLQKWHPEKKKTRISKYRTSSTEAFEFCNYDGRNVSFKMGFNWTLKPENVILCTGAELLEKWCGITITFNPLKPKLVYMLFKNSVRTSKRTRHFTITKINWLMLIKKIIAVYSENHTKPINTNAVLLTVKADGSYSYRSALKG
jgi:hypothetical protein